MKAQWSLEFGIAIAAASMALSCAPSSPTPDPTPSLTPHWQTVLEKGLDRVVLSVWGTGPNEVFVSAMSPSGTCWYLREIDGGGARFASDGSCGAADTQVYTNAW